MSTDVLRTAEAMADGLQKESMGVVGYGVATVCDHSGAVVQEVPFANLVTTAGDKWYAQAVAAAAGGAAASPGAPTGMKLGTGQTAAAKSGTGANIVTYLTGSNNTFDVTTVASAVAGTDTGWQVKYECYWADGDVTSATIWEVALVNDTVANNADGSTVANTYARVKLPTVVDKSVAGYTLRIAWYHKFLGSA